MRLAILTAGALACLLTAQLAAAGDCNGIGVCDNSVKQTTTNSAAASASAAGGAGGSAVNAPVITNVNAAEGGDAKVVKSGNSLNVNDNDQSVSVRSKNENEQKQKQQQQQKQGQYQSSKSNSKVDDSGNSYVHIEGDEYRRQTPSAFGVPLTIGNEVCAQSQTAGGSSPVFGFSLGITHDNAGCDRRRNAAVLVMLGQGGAAVELMCSDDDVRDAMRNAGTPCAADRGAPTALLDETITEEKTAAFLPMAPVAE